VITKKVQIVKMHCELLTLHNIIMEFYKNNLLWICIYTAHLNAESPACMLATASHGISKNVLVTMWAWGMLLIYEHEALGPSCLKMDSIASFTIETGSRANKRIMWCNQQAAWWCNALQLPQWQDAMESIYKCDGISSILQIDYIQEVFWVHTNHWAKEIGGASRCRVSVEVSGHLVKNCFWAPVRTTKFEDMSGHPHTYSS